MSTVIRNAVGLCIAIIMWIAIGMGIAHAELTAADLIRGLENYVQILKGQKPTEQLSPEEAREVLEIHRRLQGRASTGSTVTGYEIEASGNDEWFVINGEKYQAQTYCFGFEKGDRVMFLEGSPHGACATAKLLNLRTDEICDVWCE